MTIASTPCLITQHGNDTKPIRQIQHKGNCRPVISIRAACPTFPFCCQYSTFENRAILRVGCRRRRPLNFGAGCGRGAPMTPTNNGDDDYKSVDLSYPESQIPDYPRTKSKPHSVPLAGIAPVKAELERVQAGGWIAVHRSLLTHWLAKSSKTQPYCKGFAWVWLMLQAAHHEHRDHRGQLQRRGVVFTSQVELGEIWRWDRKKVRKYLDRLEADGMITYETNSSISVGKTTIEITNYELYQSQSNLRVQNGVSTSPKVVRTVSKNSPPTFHRGNVDEPPHLSSSQFPTNSPQHNNATKQRLSKQTESVKATHYMCRVCGKVRVARANTSCNSCVPY